MAVPNRAVIFGTIWLCILLHCDDDSGSRPIVSAPSGMGGYAGGEAGVASGGAAGANNGGISGSSGPPDPAVLCDGSLRLRLAVLSPVDPQRTQIGAAVLDELGRSFLYLDGTCRYWVRRSPGGPETMTQWLPFRSGVLTTAQAQNLAARLHYAAWYDLAGHYGPENVSDGGTITFHDGNRIFSCATPCDREAPEIVKEAYREFGSQAEELYAVGSSVQGPVRLRILDSSPPPINGPTPFAWPARVPLDQIAVKVDGPEGPPPHVQEYGNSFLLGEQEASVLRSFRDSYVAGQLGPTAQGFMVVQREEPDRVYMLFMRDALPLEDERGLIPLSSEQK